MIRYIGVAFVTYVALYCLGLASLPLFDRKAAHEAFIKHQKIGSSADYWLVKNSSFGSKDDRVAIVTGYYDDKEGCDDIAGLLNKKYPIANYICKQANFD